jgi:hypothetical protein
MDTDKEAPYKMIRPRHQRNLYASIGSQIIENREKLAWEDWMKRR